MSKKVVIPCVIILIALVLIIGIYLGKSLVKYAEEYQTNVQEEVLISDSDLNEDETYEEEYIEEDNDYYFENESVERFSRIDIKSLEEKGLNDSIEAAISYALKSGFIKDNRFYYFFPDTGLPRATQTSDIEDEEDNERTITIIYGEIPLEKRLMETKYFNNGKGKLAYVSIVEAFSRDRKTIEFDKLYERYKPIINKLISKDVYNKNYAHIVNQLLLAYTDLNGDIDKYGKVSEIMESHWDGLIENKNRDLDDFYSDLKTIISPDILTKIEANFLSEKTVYSNRAFVVWSYSFWNRRKNEGKVQEIYKALCAIRDNYTTEGIE